MKNNLLKSILISIVALLLVTMVGTAQSTSKNLVTSFTLVNVSAIDATGTIAYYKEDGSDWTGSSYTEFGPGLLYELPADGGQLQVRQYFDTLESGRGSVVVSSDTSLGAIAQVRLAPGDPNLPTSSAYVGFNGGSTKFYLPLLQVRASTATGLANAQIMIQNMDSSDISEIHINFFRSPGNTVSPATFTKTINNLKVGATYFYDLQLETNLGTGWNGSAEVDAGTNKIGVVVNSFNGPNALRTYNGFAVENIGSKWGIPLLASRLSNGLNTSISVQNLSGSDIPAGGLTLECPSAPSGFFPMSNTVVVPDKGSFSFNPVTNSPGAFPENWEGACTVSSGTKNVVTFVIMRRIFGNGDQAAYEAINYNSTSTKVIVPLMAKRLANGFATSAVIQNLSDQDAHVDLIWTPNAIECVGSCLTYTETNVIIPANGKINPNLRTPSGGFTGMDDGWQGTLKVVPATGYTPQPIQGYVVLSNLIPSIGDNYRAHNLIPMD